MTVNLIPYSPVRTDSKPFSVATRTHGSFELSCAPQLRLLVFPVGSQGEDW